MASKEQAQAPTPAKSPRALLASTVAISNADMPALHADGTGARSERDSASYMTVADCDDRAVEAERAEDVSTTNARWLRMLSATPTGRHLTEYLAHVECACNGHDVGMECPIDQVATLRRALLHALGHSPKPFGLPHKLPKYIFVANLCGRKLLMTSENSLLLQLMSHSPNGQACTERAMDATRAMVQHAQHNADHSVLMTYSMPFQVEMPNLFWDVRTIRRMPNGNVVDGQLAYHLGSSQARPVACTSSLETEASRGELDAIVEAFRENMHAINMDHDEDSVDSDSVTGLSGPNVQRLEQIVSMLKQERKKMHVEHREELRRANDRLTTATEAAGTRSAEAYAQERSDEALLVQRISTIEKALQMAVDSAAQKDTQLKTIQSAKATAELEWEGERKELRAKMVLVEASANQATKQLSRCNQDREKALKKQDTQHAKTVDEMERKYQSSVLAERTARAEGEGFMQRMQILSKTMESHDATNEAYQLEIAHLKRANKVLRGIIVFGGCRLQCAQEFAQQLPAAITRAAAAEGSLTVLRLAMNSANADVSRLQTEVDQLNAAAKAALAKAEEIEEVDATTAPVPELPVYKAVMSDHATMTLPITSKADFELGELQTTHCKLQDAMKAKERELAEVKSELQRTLKRTSKKHLSPPDCIVDAAPSATEVSGRSALGSNGGPYMLNNHVHIGNGCAGSHNAIDPGVDPSGEPGIEYIIAQAASSLRHLAEMARESSRHKVAATEGWAHARALTQYGAYQPPPMQAHGGGMMYQGQHIVQGGFIGGHSQ